MFDQELWEGERRKKGESFTKFVGRRLLVTLISLFGVAAVGFLLFNAAS